MSQYCSSNPNYDDYGFGHANDAYSSVSGDDSCAAVGGMNAYQQGLLGLTPSYCNQNDNYAPVNMMYTSTPIPDFALLQYYATQTNQKGNMFLNPKIANAAGTQVVGTGQVYQTPEAQMAINAGQAAAAQMAQAAAASAPAAEGFWYGPHKLTGKQIVQRSPGKTALAAKMRKAGQRSEEFAYY